MSFDVAATPRPPVVLEPIEHVYRQGDRVVPGVTSILKLVGAIDDRWWSEEHSLRGTRVHQSTELFDEGLLDVADCDEAIAPYVEAWARFRSEVPAPILASEQLVFHEALDYAGTLDRIVRIRGREAVLDIKSGSRAPFHAIQLAAYALTFARPLKRFCLYLTDLGTYSLVEHEDRADRDTWTAFVVAARWLREHNPTGREL